MVLQLNMTSAFSNAATAAIVAFNLVQPAQANGVYSFVDEDRDCSVSWLPYLDLLPGPRARLVEAVRRLPRRFLLPPYDGEVFKNLQAATDRVMGYSLTAGF